MERFFVRKLRFRTSLKSCGPPRLSHRAGTVKRSRPGIAERGPSGNAYHPASTWQRTVKRHLSTARRAPRRGAHHASWRPPARPWVTPRGRWATRVGHLNIGAGAWCSRSHTHQPRSCADGSIAVNPRNEGVRDGQEAGSGAASHGARLRRRRALLQRAPLRARARRRGGRGAAYHGALLHGRPRRAAEKWGLLSGRARRRAGPHRRPRTAMRPMKFASLCGGPLLRHGSR